MNYLRRAASALLAVGAHQTTAQPSFRDITVRPAQSNCPLGFNATRSPTGEVLSVLRTAKSTSAKDFLAVGRGWKAGDQSDCAFVVRFDKPLAALETMYVDVRGTVFKERQTALDWTVQVGSQRHRSLAVAGRIFDTSSDMYMRFGIGLPAGATAVRFRVQGTAASNNSVDSALVAIDAFDMCFFDAKHPEFCGPAGSPREAAKR